MKKKTSGLYTWQKAVLLALLGIAVVTTAFSGLLAPLENALLNHHLKNTRPVQNHEKIVVVMGTDKTLESVRNWPWPSSLYADLLDSGVASAKTIVLCDEFLPANTPVHDLKLVAEMRQHGNVVMGGTYLPESDSYLRPRQALEQNAAGVGYYQSLDRPDEVVRRYKAGIRDKEGGFLPSPAYTTLLQSGYGLSVDAATHVLRIQKPDGTLLHTVRLSTDDSYWLPGIAQDGYEVYEMIDVLENRVPSNVFEGALVFIGSSVSLEHDSFLTPHGEEHATLVTAQAVNALLAGFSPGSTPLWAEMLLVALLFLLCILATLRLPALPGVLVPAGFSALLFFLSWQLFAGGLLYLPVAGVIFWLWMAYLFAFFFRYIAVSTIVNHTTIPLQQTFSLETDRSFGSEENFVKHLESLHELIASTGLSVMEPLAGNEHKFVEKHKDALAKSGQELDSYVVVKNPRREKPRYQMLIPHPKVTPEEKDEYTILSGNQLKSPYAVQSVVLLIRNASLYYKALQYGREKQQLSFNIIKCMVAAMDAKDPITSGHSQRVAKISLQIAKKMGFTRRELEELELAAIVHDIGKIGIQDQILNKRGIFSSDEMKEMRLHTIKGISIMDPSGLSENTRDAILNHHERLDGHGYPSGKTLDEIGLYAKIIKISDVYDALLGERQYKKAWPLEKVCNLLYFGRGSEFDTEITDLFLEMIRPEGWAPPEAPAGNAGRAAGQHKDYVAYAREIILEAEQDLQNVQGVINSIAESPDFTRPHEFIGLEWGKPLDEIPFLLRHPYLLKYNEPKDYYCFALQLSGSFKGHAVFRFLHKYLTSGVVLLDPGSPAEDRLSEAFGPPEATAEGHLLWDAGKTFLFFQRGGPDTRDRLACVTKYEFAENGS